MGVGSLAEHGLWEFTITILVIVITPGAGFVLVMSSAAEHGRRAAAWVASGIVVGCVFPAAVSAWYVATTVMVPSVLDVFIRIGGALFLSALGARCLLQLRKPARIAAVQSPPRTERHLLAAGVVGTLMNPGIAAIYLVIIPQFARRMPASGSALGLAAIHIAFTAAWYALLVNVLGSLGDRLSRPRVRSALMALSGFALIYLGAITFTS